MKLQAPLDRAISFALDRVLRSIWQVQAKATFFPNRRCPTMTTDRAADELGVTPGQVTRMIRAGKITATKTARSDGSGSVEWKVDGKSVRKLAAQRRKAGRQ